MQVLQKPTPYTFAGNILDIVVQCNVKIYFTLTLNGVEQLRERYSPNGAGVVVIKLRDIVERLTPEALPSSGSIDIPLYGYTIGALAAETFRCVRGGHGASADAVTFMHSNWLTWQPQSRTTSYHAPMRLVYASLTNCSVWIKAYFADKSTKQIEHSKLSADRLYTINVTYGTIRGLFSDQPSAYDVWVEGGGVKSYTQRYYLAQDSGNNDVFVWHNSIGGIDTISFGGDRVERNDSESNSAFFGDTEREFDLTARKSYVKYTGYIANDNERLWVLDFFNSIGRYHIDQGAMRSVVVSKPKLEHTRGELAGYEFEFSHGDQSIYLNLPRVDTPELLEIVDPSDELFFLAPRLNQFQEARIGQGDILIPCQFANADRWLFVSIAEILSNAQGSGSGGGAPIKVIAPIGLRFEDGVYTITHHLSTAEVDLYGTADEFGHVTVPPHIYGGDRDVDFKARSVRSDDVSSHEALAAMVGGYGYSAEVDPETGKAHIWGDVGHFRDGFETLEMRYRKMIVSGEELVVNNGAVVSSVLPVGEQYLMTAGGTAVEQIEKEAIVTQQGEYIIWPLPEGANRIGFTVKGETGIDYQQFEPGDILRYTWRDADTGLKGASGYLSVSGVVNEFTYIADIEAGSPEWLSQGMSLALFGSKANTDRQGFIVLSARERTISIFDGVNSTQITPSNLKVLLGNLNLVSDPIFPEISGYGLYSQNCFIKGSFVLRNGKDVGAELSTQSTDISNLETRTQAAEIILSAAVSSIDSVTGEVNAAKAEILLQATSITNLSTGQAELATEISLKADVVRINKLLNVDGTIKTDSLIADGATITRLHAVDADVQGHVTASSGRIWALELGDDGTSFLNSEAMMFLGNGTRAFIGRNTAPAQLGYVIPAWFESNITDTIHQIGGAPNIGVRLSAKGTGYTTSRASHGNHAVYIKNGDIAGAAFNLKRLYYPTDNNITLDPLVSFYACYNNTEEMTINLPPPGTTQVGKIFSVRPLYRNVRVVGAIFRDAPKTEVWVVNKMLGFFNNDGNYWLFNYSNT